MKVFGPYADGRYRRLARYVFLFLFFLLFIPFQAGAHVKWFSDYTFAIQPVPISDILSRPFLVMLLCCMVGIGCLVYLDEWISKAAWHVRLASHLEKYISKCDLIIRVATGAVLLLSWQAGALLVPELTEYNPWLDFSQLVLAILILSNRYTQYAGAGILLLYALAWFRYGALHALDYAYLVGAGYYLMVAVSDSKKWRATALPALYSSVGLSLCWVAFEKLFYPGWSMQILQNKTFLTMGFDPAFFLPMAALTEFSLGFLLIVCLLQRPIAIAISVLFISTTLVFGKLEFVGHAVVHAALLVFVFQGTGSTFRTPITFFKHVPQRIAFSVLAFGIIFMIMLNGYSTAAEHRFEIVDASTEHHEEMVSFIDLDSPETAPKIDFDFQEDLHGGWNLHIYAENFIFAPEHCGRAHIDGYGHAHIYLDGEKLARVYGLWHHIAELPAGKHEIRVTLNSNDHSIYTLNGVPISHAKEIVIQ